MATQAAQRKAYAARSQASNIMDANRQPEVQRPGKRLQQQAGSNIFGNEDPDAKQYVRGKPAPAPFLTDDNAVNTHGRLGGYVNQTDSLLSVKNDSHLEQQDVGMDTVEELNDNANVTIEAAGDVKMCDNHNIARGHKMRNLTSNIFGADDSPAVQGGRPAYDRKNMSNVF